MNNQNKQLNICVICHLHYQKLWNEMKKYLHNLETYAAFDLFITLSRENPTLCAEILQEFSNKINITIQVIDENPYGADIYPFFYILNNLNLDNYEIIFKIHSKQNVKNFITKLPPIYDNNIYIGEQLWRNFLMTSILGKHNVKKVLKAFRNKKIGIVGFYPLQILKREPVLGIPEKFSDLANFKLIEKKRFSYHYGGTIFAIRTEILKPLQGRLCFEDFLDKATEDSKFAFMAYFFEEFFGHMVTAQGYKFYSPYNLVHKKIMQMLSHKKSVYQYINFINRFIFQEELFKADKSYDPLSIN